MTNKQFSAGKSGKGGNPNKQSQLGTGDFVSRLLRNVRYRANVRLSFSTYFYFLGVNYELWSPDRYSILYVMLNKISHNSNLDVVYSRSR